MIARDDLLYEIGWKNKDRILTDLLSLTVQTIPLTRNVRAGVVRGNDYHQELADSAASWLKSQGKEWKTEQWHSGFRCDILADGVIIEVGNTDPDRALKHLIQPDNLFCIIPYQKGEPLTMLVFRRGLKWDEAKVRNLLLEKDKHSKNILDRLGAK